jgi:hypothetical protein
MPGADPDEWDVRLGLWLTTRRENPNPHPTTNVAAKPLDRSSSAYTIAESDIEAALAELKQLRKERQAWYPRLRHAFRSGWDARGEVMAAAGGFMEAENRGQAYIAQLINVGALDATLRQPTHDDSSGETE